MMALRVLTVLLISVLICRTFASLAYVLPGGAENIVPNVRTTFSCDGKIYGYYADTDNECKIFHVCNPILDGEGRTLDVAQFSFICGNQTVFNQESLTCTDPLDAVPCADAPTYYDSVNSEFGKIPQPTPVQ